MNFLLLLIFGIQTVQVLSEPTIGDARRLFVFTFVQVRVECGTKQTETSFIDILLTGYIDNDSLNAVTYLFLIFRFPLQPM